MFSVTYLEVFRGLGFFKFLFPPCLSFEVIQVLLKAFDSQIFFSVGVFHSYRSPSILAFNYRILLNKFWLREEEGELLEFTLIKVASDYDQKGEEGENLLQVPWMYF